MADREVPYIDAESRPYWSACQQGQLLYQYCASCDRSQFYPRALCTNCFGSDQLSWRESKGLGSVYSFTVIHTTFEPGWRSSTPYIVALVDLDEGYRMMSNVVAAEGTEVAIGSRVAVSFEALTAEVSVPVFALAD